MIGQRYREKKTAVLDVVARYQSIRGANEDGVDPAFLDQRAEALREGRYVLAVVGETKAGKSTLINALLGERILPTDILQSSSAVIEIFKSEEKYVSVTYADGHTEKVRDDLNTPDIDEAVEHLRKIGSIQDRFRTIPTTIIDAYIVQGKITPGTSSLIPDLIPELEEASDRSLVGKEDLIAEYVRGRTLAEIPVEISFGFPLRYAFNELRLVDSPGVNASGGVQDHTFAYLHTANAVLFVHSLEEAVEKNSFRKFIEQVVPNRTRQALFLVLSKSGLRSELEIEEKVAEVRSLYSEEFDEQRVIYVDAMLKIIASEIQDYESALDLKQHYINQQKLFSERHQAERKQVWRDEAVTYDTKRRLLNETLEATGTSADKIVVQQELARRSNFEVLENAIEEFSNKAPELQLSELLSAVKRGYENQLCSHNQNRDLLEKKRKHPQTFENEIHEIKNRISEYQLSMHEFSEGVTQEYTGRDASTRGELDSLKLEYTTEIDSASGSDGVRRALDNFDDANCAFIDRVEREMKEEFEEELRREGEEFKAKHSITVPSVDIAGIAASAKETAYRETEVERGPQGFFEWARTIISFGRATHTDKTEVYDPDLFLSNYQSLAVRVVTETVMNDPILVSKFLDCFTASFRQSLNSLINSRLEAIEDIRTQKSTNAEILEEITGIDQKKKDIDMEMTQVSEILEDLR